MCVGVDSSTLALRIIIPTRCLFACVCVCVYACADITVKRAASNVYFGLTIDSCVQTDRQTIDYLFTKEG